MTGRPVEPDDRRLVARLIHEEGVQTAALMIPRAEIEALIVAAVDIGERRGISKVTLARHCRVCGCTEFNACRPEPCGWAEVNLCTVCAEFPEEIVQ